MSPAPSDSALPGVAPSKLFRVKICGITRVTDATMAVAAGADAIGLNFYEPSPRSVAVERAAEIVAAISSKDDSTKSPLIVGVFVNSPVETIQEIAEQASLSAIQLHGDETVDVVAELDRWPVIRAFRMVPGDDTAILEYVRNCQAKHPLAGVLIDAAVPGEFGGTGKKADWNEVANLGKQLRQMDVARPRLILAGGLTAENVATAIATANPYAVDTASGVESAAGIKDPIATREFVTASLSAFG